MQIKISDATFSHYLPSIVPISWDIQSDNISDVTLTGTSLAVTQNGAAGNYETAASSNLQKATITMPIGSPSAVNVVVLGELTSLDYAVLYLDGTGTVRQFHKDGNVLTLPTIFTMAGAAPVAAKGTSYTIEKMSDRWKISIGASVYDVMFSSISTLSTAFIGVILTDLVANFYTLEDTFTT